MKRHASMNRIFRLVWSQALDLRVAVAETARRHAKGSASHGRVELASAVDTSGGGSSPAQEPDGAGLACLGRLTRVPRAIAGLPGLLCVWAMLVGPVHAGLPGGQVVAGSSSSAHSASVITQAGARVAADWNRFSTAAAASDTVIQSDVQATAINRIAGSSPRSPLASLSGDAQMFGMNPNGVLSGAGAQGNVSGLITSALGLRISDSMAGRTTFANDAGSIGMRVNQDAATAVPDGYVVVLAPEVRNEGVTGVARGAAQMSAGTQVIFSLNNGSLLRYKMDRGVLSALTANRPPIPVDGVPVILSVQALNALSRASVNNGGAIEAMTLEHLAERIRLLANMAVSTAGVSAALDTSAPAAGGGGCIETSAASGKIADATVITSLVPVDQTGTWLIDHQKFRTESQASAGALTNVAAGEARKKTNVVYNSGDGAAATNGDLLVNQCVSWTANHSPALNALRSVDLLDDGSLHAAGTMGSMVLNAGTGTTRANLTTRARAP